MKRPIIKDIDRWAAIKYPDSLAGAAVIIGIETARLKRYIGNQIEKTWLWRKLIDQTAQKMFPIPLDEAGQS